MKTRLPLIASALLLISLAQIESAYAVQGNLTTTITKTLVSVPETLWGLHGSAGRSREHCCSRRQLPR